MIKNFEEYNKVNEEIESVSSPFQRGLSIQKFIWVGGEGDHHAMMFEEAHKGASVDDIANNPQNYQGDWEIEAHEFSPIDPKFIEIIKSKQDYDISKTENFYTGTV